MLSYVSEWSLADVTAVQNALSVLPDDIRRKLEDLVLNVVYYDLAINEDATPEGDFLYDMVQVSGT